MLGTLTGAGLVRKEFDGKTTVYRAAQARHRAGVAALRRVVDVFFGGWLLSAVSVHLAEPRELDREELEELRRLLDARLDARLGKPGSERKP